MSAHPRSRGENEVRGLLETLSSGSSPLTRGKRIDTATSIGRMGLIPAHAGKTTTTHRTRSLSRAHPRSRGENIETRSALLTLHGSSPLTRGKHDLRDRLTPEDRLIPAHAGKTPSRVPMPHGGWAHPRSRGENTLHGLAEMRPAGSSPLTRGKRITPHRIPTHSGLIPAHAGKTISSPGRLTSNQAHPRSRGENQVHAVRAQITKGSSPLTRGKPLPRRPGARGLGLIPAHAGKTARISCAACRDRAHPRSRGENRAARGGPCGRRGSSPLTRGKRIAVVSASRSDGLIPAHAGKTARAQSAARTGGAHPRSRGENLVQRGHGQASFGSSPLTRGKRRGPSVAGCTGRLIPAHAGKTPWRGLGRLRCGAHPRSRGENLVVRVMPSHVDGSSPLTRGKHERLDAAAKPTGLIPAHAGKTYPRCGGQSPAGAHPRSRGENVLEEIGGDVEKGSSPLTRGKLARADERDRTMRLIPAHAGKTATFNAFTSPPPAHPRSRGENEHFNSLPERIEGSSPLTRGKHFLTWVFIAQIGQILESLELCASSESYSSQDAYATGAPQDQVRSIGLGLRSSRDAS